MDKEKLSNRVVRDRDDTISLVEGLVRDRKEPVPLFRANSMPLDRSRPGFRREWINETELELTKYINAGYSLVYENSDQENARIQNNSQMGELCRIVANYHPEAKARHQVLVEIPIEEYEKQQALYWQENKRLADSIDPNKASVPGADFGKLYYEKSN